MPADLAPPLSVLREIHQSAVAFLQAAADAGSVEGIGPRPTGRGGFDPYTSVRRTWSMALLERALNPRRLKHDDQDLRGIAVCSPFGEQHLSALSESLAEIRDGLATTFNQWGIDRFWGCASYGFGGPPNPRATWAPGHEHFVITGDWPPPIPRRVFDAMMYAVGQLGECIRYAEEAASKARGTGKKAKSGSRSKNDDLFEYEAVQLKKNPSLSDKDILEGFRKKNPKHTIFESADPKGAMRAARARRKKKPKGM